MFKIFENIINYIIKISCFFNLPILTAIILILTIKKNKKINYNLKSKKKIIYLYKSIGIKDLEVSFKKTPSENPIYICSRSYFITIFIFFVGNKVKDFNYINSGSEIDKIKYKDYLIKMLAFMQKIWNVGGFISSNVVYRADRELQNATKYLGLIFIVIHKESIKSEKGRLVNDWLISVKIPKFNGNKIIVYNQDEKNSFIRSGFCKRDKIEVCGSPRFDNFIKINKIKKNNKTITFFLIQKNYGLPIKEKNWIVPNHLKKKINCKKFDWSYLENTYKKLIIDFIKKNPDFKIYIKSKPNVNTNIRKSDIIKYKNVEIISGGDSLDLIRKSKFVVAFNTSVMLEAIAAKRILISLKDLVRDKSKKGFMLNTSNFDLPSSALKNINKIKMNSNNLKEKKKLLLKYMGNIDGKSSLRVGNALNKYFKEV